MKKSIAFFLLTIVFIAVLSSTVLAKDIDVPWPDEWDNITITAKCDSEQYYYAIEHHHEFVSTGHCFRETSSNLNSITYKCVCGATKEEPITVICGDVNCDGKVTSADVMIFQRYIAGWYNIEFAENIKFSHLAANTWVRGDTLSGYLSSRDTMTLQRKVANWQDYQNLPIE